MTDKSFKEKLSVESKLRESIMEDTLRSLEDYKTKQIKEEKKQEQYRIAEIKYKTTINELNDYINIYKKKLEELNQKIEGLESEILSLKKKNLKYDTDMTAFKSILDLFVKEYGIDKIVEITNIEKKKIESYIGEK